MQLINLVRNDLPLSWQNLHFNLYKTGIAIQYRIDSLSHKTFFIWWSCQSCLKRMLHKSFKFFSIGHLLGDVELGHGFFISEPRDICFSFNRVIVNRGYKLGWIREFHIIKIFQTSTDSHSSNHSVCLRDPSKEDR